jgi:hypothetical protein
MKSLSADDSIDIFRSPQVQGAVFYSCGFFECLRGTPTAGATNRQPHEQHKKPKISFAVSLLSRSLYGNHQKGILHFRTPTRGITGVWKQWDHP